METRLESEARLLSYAGLARLLDVSERHLRRLVESGRLPEPIRLGGSIRFKVADVLAALQALPTEEGER